MPKYSSFSKSSSTVVSLFFGFFFNSNHLSRYETVSHCGFFFKFFLNGPFLKSLWSLLQYYFCFLCSGFFGWEACRILAHPTGIEPVPSALEGKVLITDLQGRPSHCGFGLHFPNG